MGLLLMTQNKYILKFCIDEALRINNQQKERILKTIFYQISLLVFSGMAFIFFFNSGHLLSLLDQNRLSAPVLGALSPAASLIISWQDIFKIIYLLPFLLLPFYYYYYYKTIYLAYREEIKLASNLGEKKRIYLPLLTHNLFISLPGVSVSWLSIGILYYFLRSFLVKKVVYISLLNFSGFCITLYLILLALATLLPLTILPLVVIFIIRQEKLAY